MDDVVFLLTPTTTTFQPATVMEFKKPDFPPRKSSEAAVTIIEEEKGPPAEEPPPPRPVAPLAPPKKSKEQIASEKALKYAEILSSLKYTPPETGSPSADSRYSFEVLKTGTIVDRVRFSKLDNKGFYVVGRVPGCDVVAENPTVSRTHAVLQFIHCDDTSKKKKATTPSKVGNGEEGTPDRTGLYLFDLNSTHGTYINKNQVFPGRYYRLHVGHVLKFGNSTRLYVLLGPSEDEEEEDEKSVTELQNERLYKELERKKLEEQGLLINIGDGEGVEGCGWGMGEDAVEDSDLRENPFAMNFEEGGVNFDNPKKTLRGWFEREGYDLVYDCREKANGQFICRIDLPVDGPSPGQPVFAEVDIKGKKKEAVHQAALQACQILDKYGVLRQANHESKSVKRKKPTDDYYSSDDDTYLDRTGSIEKKREKRLKSAGKLEAKVETFESLSTQSTTLQQKVTLLQSQISAAQQTSEKEMDIDDYVQFLKTGATEDVKKLKAALREATEELKRVNRLVEVARPSKVFVPAPSKKVVGGGDVTILDTPSAVPAEAPTTSSPDKQEGPAGNSTTTSPLEGPSTTSKPFKMQITKPRPPVLASASVAPPSLEKKKKQVSKKPLKDSSSDSSDEEEKSKKIKGPPQPTTPKKKAAAEYDTSDPKYSTWVPPSGQTGDGRTSLNEKWGY